MRVLALVLCCAAVTAVAMPAASASAGGRTSVLAKVNSVRSAHGMRPLRVSRSLTHSSRRYGRHLARTNTFQHAPRIQASSKFRSLGECLGWMAGRKVRPMRQVRAWLRSSSHRAVLLNPRYRWIGAAHVKSRLGHRRSTIWVAQLGR